MRGLPGQGPDRACFGIRLLHHASVLASGAMTRRLPLAP